jgi:hypothetical protein
MLGQLINSRESSSQFLQVRWFCAIHPLRMLKVLAKAEDGKEGREESDLIHLEVVRV